MKSERILPILLMLVCFLSFNIMAQDQASRPSPALEAKGELLGAEVTLKYGAPSVKGRKIWGELVPFGKVWRTGANEATTFETSKDLVIQGKTLPAGKYALFTIPGEKDWTWIFNSVWEQWGAYKYDESKDVLRVVGQAQASPVFHEQMRMVVDNNKVTLYWENLQVSF